MYLNIYIPDGHYMYHQFNIQQFQLCLQCIYVFFIYLRTNSELCHIQHKLIGFYNTYLDLYHPLVTICTTSLTFNNCKLWPHCIYVFCIYLGKNSDLCHLLHKLIGFCNRDEKCLQRGAERNFKWRGLEWVFKGINSQIHTISNWDQYIPTWEL